MLASQYRVRDYRAEDERSWLRCRALAFLDTGFYDDVKAGHGPMAEAGDVGLVAIVPESGEVAALFDATADDGLATIDCVAVHPDHTRAGLASALFAEALRRLRDRAEVTSIDAWAREDEPALAWYRAHGFSEDFRYLHVYAEGAEIEHAVTGGDELVPVQAFLHASIDREEELRKRFARVYVCRRFVREL